MSSIQEYACLLKHNYHPQLVFPELAREIGLEESLVLQQIHYWLKKAGKSIDGNVWIYNTYDQWKEQFSYWSNSKIVRIFTSLKEQGFVISKKMNAHKSNHTNWYSINYKKLVKTMEKLISEKKFTRTKIEKSFCQNEQIIISKTNNNYSKNNLSKEAVSKVKQDTKTNIKNQTDLLILEKKVSEAMLSVWNEVFIKTDKAVLPNENRNKKLYTLWKEVFAEDIEQWQNFCVSVNSSKFLMGEKKSSFKAHFDWIISNETVSRIRAGEFDIGDRVPDIKQAELKESAEKAKIEYELKLDAERRQRETERMKLEIERLSEKLAKEELDKIEASWTEDDFSNAKQSFEKFLEDKASAVDNNTFMQAIKDGFERQRWQTPFIDMAFEEFKLRTFLKKKCEDFIDQAKELLVAPLICLEE
jgi:hypothetical protein